MKDARRFLPLRLVLLVGLMLAVWLPGLLVAPSRQRKKQEGA